MLQDDNSKLNGSNKNKSPLIAEGHDMNSLPINYCWYHGITSNIFHNRKYCKHHKKSHKLNATYQNYIGVCTECCKVRKKLIKVSTTGSNNNTVK